MTAWFRVMTYNVRYDNPDDGAHAWPNRRRSVAGTLRFHDPALIGLQEPLDHQLDDLKDDLSGFAWVGRPRVDGDRDGEYTPIGYRTDRFTLKDHDTFWLSETPEEAGSLGWDARHPRIVTWARLEEARTGTTFLHANTHFSHDGRKARMESARLALDRLDDLADGAPVVLTGDFNAAVDDPTYDALLDGPLDNAIDRSRHPHHGPKTSVSDFERLVPSRKIDHVFVTEDVDVRQHGVCADLRSETAYPSDHLPVVADCRVPE
ncbi:endonuclease/exonuclease/phosphatase family protein [Halococcoides cellulosivorans]|uniref:Endonuclease n=1 Tax=Halococcoides cellulosivorans TaxID=1679096 RepID=A0A2R4X0N1_9EURY|nr:endonuclease/exonuclease/phosphatase family protein [Halococcoides cellulosivorans]AWB27349.1 endonuclease [Halococcoides cellulosivorans]